MFRCGSGLEVIVEVPAAGSSLQMMGWAAPNHMLGLDVEASLRQASAAPSVSDSGDYASVCRIGDIGVVPCQVRHGVSTRSRIALVPCVRRPAHCPDATDTWVPGRAA